MDQPPSMESYLTGRSSDPAPNPTPPAGKGLIPAWVQATVLIVLLLAVAYLLYENYRFQQEITVEFANIQNHFQLLENQDIAGEAKMSDLEDKLNKTKRDVGSTRTAFKRSTEQILLKSAKTKAELSLAIAGKADTRAVQAIKHDADTKIKLVNSEVGGVKNEVGTVKTNLAGTKRDLEGTQRELVDIKASLTAAVAKNATELAALRLKGERDYIEFTINKKNRMIKVEDIRLVLKKTDRKRGKYNIQIVVDDSKLEKKNLLINEPLQFLVGRNRVRYELVVNWVQKNRVGGYLSVPKDKALSAERISSN